VANLGLDSETALQLILIVLRGAAYFFGGFALVGLSAYVVFLCLEIFSPRPQVKATIAEVPKPLAALPGLNRLKTWSLPRHRVWQRKQADASGPDLEERPPT